jgi:hypothetical protein
VNVIPLTVLCSLALVGLFAVLFLRSRRGGAGDRPEQSSLLPFEEEGVRSAREAEKDERDGAPARGKVKI